MGLDIVDEKTEESMRMPYRYVHEMKGTLIRGTIAYLEDLIQKKGITKGALMSEGHVDLSDTTQDSEDALKAKVSEALEIVKSWSKVARSYMELPYHYERIPPTCPSALNHLRLGGLFHIVQHSDCEGQTTYEEATDVAFLVKKIEESEAIGDPWANEEYGFEGMFPAMGRVFGACQEGSIVHWR